MNLLDARQTGRHNRTLGGHRRVSDTQPCRSASLNILTAAREVERRALFAFLQDVRGNIMLSAVLKNHTRFHPNQQTDLRLVNETYAEISRPNATPYAVRCLDDVHVKAPAAFLS